MLSEKGDGKMAKWIRDEQRDRAGELFLELPAEIEIADGSHFASRGQILRFAGFGEVFSTGEPPEYRRRAYFEVV